MDTLNITLQIFAFRTLDQTMLRTGLFSKLVDCFMPFSHFQYFRRNPTFPIAFSSEYTPLRARSVFPVRAEMVQKHLNWTVYGHKDSAVRETGLWEHAHGSLQTLLSGSILDISFID